METLDKKDSCVVSGDCGQETEVPRVVGHRGTAEAFTENGIMAFQYAMEHGVTGFETDFRMTKDGVVVVMHDSNIRRTTTGEGVVEEMTLAEIKQFQMKNSDEKVPTAEELFALFDKRKGYYLELELKARYGAGYDGARMDAYLERLYQAAEKHLGDCTYAFTCFEADILKRAKQLHPELKTGLIMGPLTQERLAAAWDARCHCIAPTLDGSPRELVDKAKASGLKVNLWHSETIGIWKTARDMGADVSTNNHPVEVLQAIRNLQG